MASAKEARAKIVAYLSVTHHRDGLLSPVEVGPHVGAARSKVADEERGQFHKSKTKTNRVCF
jgi:hypothetical protein